MIGGSRLFRERGYVSVQRVMLAVTAAEWDGIKHRPHHFMRRCARSGWTVVYLEPPATLIAPFKDRGMLRRWRKWRRGLRKAEDNLYLLAPPPVLPFANKHRMINRFNQRLIARTVEKTLRAFGPVAVDLYAFLPGAVDLLPRLSLKRVIYDCVDDHAAFTGLINPAVVRRMERELMARADVSFATAKQLLEERRGWGRRLYLVPNGAEYAHFATGGDGGLPADMAGIPAPIAGFVGGISDWVDLPLLSAVARRMPHVSFVLIGPVATDTDGLRALPNVRLLGARPYELLPRYMHHFDTCLIPFRINKLTAGVNPIKLYEYLSAGKPVVSTPLPEVVPFGDVVEIAAGEEATVRAIERTLAPVAATEERVRRRRQVGRDNSWDTRWNAVLEHIAAPDRGKQYV